jgi:DNA-binding transcriptional LysR family regulator
MAQLLPEFLARYPNIRLVLDATNRRVDVLNEGFDVALRVRTTPTGEDGLVMRTFGQSRHLLVASGTYLEQRGRPERPEDLAQHGTLSFAPQTERHSWDLLDSSGVAARVDDFPLLRAAVLAGLGIALLPESVVKTDIESGRLEQVLPAWTLPLGVFHVVFPTRRGLLPSVRAFIDFLAERMPGAV